MRQPDNSLARRFSLDVSPDFKKLTLKILNSKFHVVMTINLEFI